MKGVTVYKRKTGATVVIGYTPCGGERQRELIEFVENGPRFTERIRAAQKRAEARLLEAKAAIANGVHDVHREKRKRTMTFGQYVADYYTAVLTRSKMKERPRKRELQRITSGTLGKFFWHTPMSGINRTLVERYIEHRLEAGAGAAGINRDLARLSHIWHDAEDRPELGLVSGRNPCARMKLQEQPKSYRPMREDEEERLMRALEPPARFILRVYFEFLLHTGVRPEAVKWLRWADCDLAHGSAFISRAINKTQTRDHIAYFNSQLWASMRALYAFRPEDRRRPEDFVFAHRNGKRRKSVRTSWRSICADAAIVGLHVRGLRATAGTRIQESGGSLIDCKMHLGHSAASIGGVTGRYLDPQEAHRRKIAEMTIRWRPKAAFVGSQISDTYLARGRDGEVEERTVTH